ncbi:unnamed protein product [Sphagnum balticum]
MSDNPTDHDLITTLVANFQNMKDDNIQFRQEVRKSFDDLNTNFAGRLSSVEMQQRNADKVFAAKIEQDKFNDNILKLTNSNTDTINKAIGIGAPAEFDWSVPVSKNIPSPGKDQNSSSSCPAQAFSYGFYAKTKIDISREDIYSHIFLPGGGAYLIAPAQYVGTNGYLPLSKFPDPSPETEENMEAFVMNVQDGDRIRSFRITPAISSVDSIDAVAEAIVAHDFVVLGIYYTPEGFGTSWTYPTYYSSYPDQDGHALWAMNPIIHDGLNAIDCESSWYGAEGPDGISTHHVIDQNFFANGGVFELLTVDVQEISTEGSPKPMYQKAVHKDGKTFAVLITTPNGALILDAVSADIWTSWSKSDSYGLTTINTDGSPNFDVTDCIQLGF